MQQTMPDITRNAAPVETAVSEEETALFVANFNRFLIAGVKNEATTICLFPGSTISYRVGAKLMKGPNPVLTQEHTHALAMDILPVALLDDASRECRARFVQRVKSANFSYSIQGVARFKIHLFRQRGSLAMCIRVIPQDIPDIKTYNIPDDFFSSLKEMKGGLYVIHGRVRSGKSSLAASIVDHVNRTQNRLILVLEPTIQFSHKNQYSLITQRELGTDIADLPTGILDAVRQDQDIVVLDELSDPETFERVLDASIRGITIFAIMGTPDVEKTVAQILMFRPASRQMDLIQDLMTYLRGVLTVDPHQTPDGRKAVRALFIPANILNGFLLSKRTELEQKHSTTGSAPMGDIEGASSVDQSWFDAE